MSILLSGAITMAWYGVHTRLLYGTGLRASLKEKLQLSGSEEEPMLLVLALDGVPYRVMEDLKKEGRFAEYGKPRNP